MLGVCFAVVVGEGYLVCRRGYLMADTGTKGLVASKHDVV